MSLVRPADGVVAVVFQPDNANSTSRLLYGQLDQSSLSSLHANSSLHAAAPYDGRGALSYIVVVMVVYSFSMVFLVASLLRRKTTNNILDGQVNTYMKGLEAAQAQDRHEQLLRMRLHWPGNFIRFGFESYSGSDVREGEAGACMRLLEEDEPPSSPDIYIEMPASTLQLSLDEDTESSEDDDSSCDVRLPTIYEIPEFMRRNRRHGDMRPIIPAPSQHSYQHHVQSSEQHNSRLKSTVYEYTL